MFKFLIRLLPMLFGFINANGALFNSYIKPSIQIADVIKKMVKDTDAITEFSADFIKGYLKEKFPDIHLGLNHGIQLLSRALVDILPASVFENVDKRKYYDVIAAGGQYLRTVDNKWLLSSYLLNIASWIFIELNDDQMKITEANYLVQAGYTHMKVKKMI